jgi:hypothetical protein
MKRHIATALIAGIGLAAPGPAMAGASQQAEVRLPAGRPDASAVCRMSRFGHLKSAGRFRRNEIAKICVDEGMVFAEWSGQVDAPHPRRIETEELDAEWMAHCHDGRWMVNRRELVASNGKMWSVQVYGDSADGAKVQIVGTAQDVDEAGAEAFTVNYEQTAVSARLSVRGNREGRILRHWNAVAPTLGDLRKRYPIIVTTYLEPALGKMVC